MPTDPSPAARVFVGCAGWSLPRDAQQHFPAAGTHLERYAARFPASEVNSSFYRPHRPATYARWAASVPRDFRFSVKVPRTITHDRRLADAGDLLDDFLAGVAALGPALGCLLVQLPPSLAFHPPVADEFCGALRERYDGPAVVEPRHASWLGREADALLSGHRVGRAAADPALAPAAAEPGGWPGTLYYRLHGTPRVYYSAYDATYLEALAARLRRLAGPAWCIFDNTAAGAATDDARHLLALLSSVR